MSKQIFGNNHKNNTPHEQLAEYDPAEQNKKYTLRMLMILCAIFLVLQILLDDKSSVLSCNIPNDTCELRIRKTTGSKEIKKVTAPSNIKDFYAKFRCYRRNCYVNFFIVEKNDKHIFLYNKDFSKFSINAKRKKFNKAAEDIKCLLKNNGESFEYDLLNPVKKP